MRRKRQGEARPKTGLTIHWGLFRYVKPHWRPLIVCLVGMGAGVVLGLATPWPLKIFIDNVAGHAHTPGWLRSIADVVPGLGFRDSLLVVVVVASLLFFVLGILASMLEQIAGIRLNQRMTYDLAGDLFSHLQRLSPVWHSRRSTGDTIARVTGDPAAVQVFVTDAALPLVQSLVSVAAMIAIMLTLQPVLTLLALAVSPFMLLTIRFFARPMKERNRVARDLEGGIMGLVEQTLTSIPVVQAFTREDRNRQVFRRDAAKLVKAYESATRIGIAFQFFVGLTTALGTALILYLGGRYVIDGKMSVGTIVVFLSYLNGLYGPLNAMTHMSETIQYAAAQGDRVMEIMNVEPDVQEPPAPRELAIRGSVRYSNVTFGYEPGRPVLHDVSLESEPGDVIAIVGPTGAGKTTLVNLLPRFFDPWEGSVTIDGVDVRDMSLKSLRGQVALVLQDPFLFGMSVSENIAYGRPEATREEIVEAAKNANAHDFIERLPGGYDSIIGERGATLSGGEKQRVSIARAFLKDAPVLILDEPTSALDARTEAMLLGALERLMEGRLTFIIAHRLSTIRHADKILVIDEGRIVEQGAHHELVALDGMYAGLYHQQMEIARHEAEEAGADAAEAETVADPQ